MLGPLDLHLIWNSLPDLFSGLVVTLQLTVMTVVGGILLSVPLGVLRTSPNRVISGPIWAYTYFFRGTPMLIQLFLIYYGLAQFKAVRSSGLWFILREGYWCCLVAFTLNTAAYTIEIIAGALRNVPLGDIEAARAMGMSPFTILRRIKFPIATRILFPAYTNEVVFILQSTSLASLVTVMDLTGAARVVIARTFAPYEMFITIGIIYLILTYLTLWGFRRIEGHLYRHLRSRKEVVSEVPVLRSAVSPPRLNSASKRRT